jgi:hypothetical protein
MEVVRGDPNTREDLLDRVGGRLYRRRSAIETLRQDEAAIRIAKAISLKMKILRSFIQDRDSALNQIPVF